jgi:hypothetical protein
VTLEKLVEKLGAKKSGKEWVTRCPAHDDGTPSLAISRGDNGSIVLHCHAGCTTENVLESAGLTYADLYPEETKPMLTDTYDYTDERFNLLFQVCRYKPKTFRFRRPDGKGGWIWKLDDVRRVLYNLPEVVHPENKTIAICEGEKDCITAHVRFGLCATTNPMGAGSWRDEYSEFLRGKNVFIFPDNDKEGLEHADQVARSLYGKANSVKICILPPKTKDLSDWNVPPDEAARYIGSFSVPWSPDEKSAADPLLGCSVAELFKASEKKVDWLCWPFAAPGFASILDALPKVGKTEFLLRGMLASRTGQLFLGFPTKLMRTVFISEQSRGSLATQMRQVGFTGEEPSGELWIITREDWSRYVYVDLLVEIEKRLLAGNGYNMLVADTFHSIARLEDENDPSEVNRLGNLTLNLASRYSLGLVLGRHDRKMGGPVGVSGRSSIHLSGLMDVILHLVRRPVPTERKLEILGRLPDLPNEQVIDLQNNNYVNLGKPESKRDEQAAALDALLSADLTIGYRSIAFHIKMSKNRIRELAESLGWERNEETGTWQKK